jgi:hypothetical protein
MDKQELFEIWAPAGSIWSPWVKPVLFAHYPRLLPPPPPWSPPDLSALPSSLDRRAIVVDFHGVESVLVGTSLAEMGYRPVPLFNACPPPVDFPSSASLAVVDADSILAVLVQNAERLRTLALPANAPPAFLVDAKRQHLEQPIRPGLFDNRSVLFITDFPSATFLKSQDIRRVLLVRARDGAMDRDLAYILRSWQKGGLGLGLKCLSDPGPPQPLTIGGSWLWFGFWHRLSTFFGLRRNPQGGFGAFVPEAASG